jgi:hypothetical protein
MIMLIALIVVIANALTAGRLILYQRRGARYRPAISLLAYLLMVFAFWQVVDMLIHHFPASMGQAGMSVVVAALVLRARGNVACIVRIVS